MRVFQAIWPLLVPGYGGTVLLLLVKVVSSIATFRFKGGKRIRVEKDKAQAIYAFGELRSITRAGAATLYCTRKRWDLR